MWYYLNYTVKIAGFCLTFKIVDKTLVCEIKAIAEYFHTISSVLSCRM